LGASLGEKHNSFLRISLHRVYRSGYEEFNDRNDATAIRLNSYENCNMKCAVVLLCFLSIFDARPNVVINRPIPRLETAGRFKKRLKKPLTFSWKYLELREVLKTVSDNFHISILLDRRIDPDQKLDGILKEISLKQGLESIAKSASAEIRVVANTVYIGPSRSADLLQELVRLRRAELVALTKEKQFSKRRHGELAQRNTLHWNDLVRPAGIIEQLSRRYKLEVKGLDRIEHDLWAHATLPGINSYEALSLVLIQFDLTFQWNNNASAIQIVPVPTVTQLDQNRGQSSPSSN
jgi:hypothetical protein